MPLTNVPGRRRSVRGRRESIGRRNTLEMKTALHRTTTGNIIPEKQDVVTLAAAVRITEVDRPRTLGGIAVMVTVKSLGGNTSGMRQRELGLREERTSVTDAIVIGEGGDRAGEGRTGRRETAIELAEMNTGTTDTVALITVAGMVSV